MSHILLTGFTPFDGREYNASWIAARALIAQHNSAHILHGLRIPVCWGAPLLTLGPALARWQPRCIIAMGEGAQGLFKIETLARNQRGLRQDNDGQLPSQSLIDPMGPDSRSASAPCETLNSRLLQSGYPVQLSSDAGAFLCEELLYSIEMLKEQNPYLQTVLFIHLPPFGSPLALRGESRQCNEGLLLEFSKDLLKSLIDLGLL